MPLQNVDFVPECGAFKQRIEKELRSMRPRDNRGAQVLGPYAIPEVLPIEVQSNPAPPSRPSDSRCSTTSSKRSTGTSSGVSSRLKELEQQIEEERDGRKQVEEQLDRLQNLLQQLTTQK